jgi:predicted Zn-dependent protease
LSATPDSTQVVADAAAIDLADGHALRAAHLLDDQLENDPLDGTLRLSAAAAALVLGQREKAIALARQAGADDPGDVLKVAILIADARRRRS